ncbi:peptide/nickel transport system permease protein [Leucobacter exalbidus]|uniref:Peptide/nickel transport system permease protein n=1 Tax=Leucobacter exalbidus TaxID=662960 RepID=A0A940T192_9MICO|nr:ABC transporter permease [Leucobacter exalbidus]MBP1326640.1 peptide/nickel transport system permease protein [Leucobacter exalbidus]
MTAPITGATELPGGAGGAGGSGSKNATQPATTNAPQRRPRLSATLWVGAAMVALIVVIALVSLVWLPYPLDDTTGGRLEGPNAQHLLGTDKLGRDLVSQLMVGARIALMVGAGSVVIAAVIGVTVGIIAALATSWVDDAISAFIDVAIAFPVLLTAMLIVALQPPSLGSAIVAIGLAMSAVVARIARILAKTTASAQFVTAARTSGTGTWGIVRRHLLPNMAPTLYVTFALQFGAAVLAEASLSYLGLGAPPPNASWGRLLQEAQGTVLTAPAGAIAPGLALVVLVLGVNFVADGLRDVADPTRRKKSKV